jgi:hypothetical protein
LTYELKDIVAAIGIGVTLLVGLLNLYISLKNTKKAKFIDVVTSERLKWVSDIRQITSQYIAKISLLHYWNRQEHMFKNGDISKESYQKRDNKEIENLKLEIDELYYKLQLFLIRNDKTDDEILEQVKIVYKIGENLNLNEVNEIINNFIKLINKVVSNEWYKVKFEAEHGNISHFIKNKEWINLQEVNTISELKNRKF